MIVITIIGFISSLITIGTIIFKENSAWEKIGHLFYLTFISVILGLYLNQYRINAELKNIENQAQQIIKNANFSDDGSMRGFVFECFSFLEKNKEYFPDTYSYAKKLIEECNILESKQDDGMERLHQTWRLQDISKTMKGLILGISITK